MAQIQKHSKVYEYAGKGILSVKRADPTHVPATVESAVVELTVGLVYKETCDRGWGAVCLPYCLVTETVPVSSFPKPVICGLQVRLAFDMGSVERVAQDVHRQEAVGIGSTPCHMVEPAAWVSHCCHRVDMTGLKHLAVTTGICWKISHGRSGRQYHQDTPVEVPARHPGVSYAPLHAISEASGSLLPAEAELVDGCIRLES
jgi:hypothetical protein